MKKILICFILFSSYIAYPQFYPKLEDVFLTEPAEESVFTKEQYFFREWLQKTTKPMFMGDVQFSGSGRNIFFSLGLIPHKMREAAFFDTGIVVKFLPNSTDIKKKMPMTFNGKDSGGDEPGVKGYMQVYEKEGIALELLPDALKLFDAVKEKGTDTDPRCLFFIKNIDFEIGATGIKITTTGNFNSKIRIKKSKAVPDSIDNITFEIKGTQITVTMSYAAGDKTESIVIASKKVTP